MKKRVLKHSVIIPDYVCFTSFEAYNKARDFAKKMAEIKSKTDSHKEELKGKRITYFSKFYVSGTLESEELQLDMVMNRIIDGVLETKKVNRFENIPGFKCEDKEDGTTEVSVI